MDSEIKIMLEECKARFWTKETLHQKLISYKLRTGNIGSKDILKVLEYASRMGFFNIQNTETNGKNGQSH